MSTAIDSLVDRLRAAREMAGLSQGQVAGLLRLHRPAVSEIEAGRRKVSAEELAQFADAYGVSVQWLLGKNIQAEDPMVELAARELSKLGRDDLDRVMGLLKTLRRSKGDDR
jgi:transcriptional regulator with XRE-family HTH domain